VSSDVERFDFDVPLEDAETTVVSGPKLGMPVDPPDRRTVFFDAVVHDNQLAPIVPAALRGGNLADTAKTGVRQAGHRTAFHLVRAPKYAAKTALWAPVGIFVGCWRVAHWAFDLESFGIRQHAATRNATDDYLKLSKQRDRRVGGRVRIMLACLVLLAAGVWALLAKAPDWAKWVALATAVPMLAVIGRPADKPITDRVLVGEPFIKLTAELTRAALVACGAGIKLPGDVKFERDIYRDPPGWTAIVSLPSGIIATDVIDKRDRLAAGFRLPKSQVWPSSVPGAHPGVLRIWVADRPVSDMRQPPWPLLNGGKVDYFQRFPFGFNERMEVTYWSLDQKNSLFAGIPGSGKSLALRVVLLGAIQDPLVDLMVFELKGGGDLDDFEPLCRPGHFGSGADETTKQRALDALQWLARECDRRGPIMKHYAAQGLNDTNNVNRAMASRDPRLRLLVAVFDELQELLTDKELGKTAVPLLTSVVKRARALGIHLILATQRIDKESIPRGVSSNVALRWCGAVTAHTEADMVLGTGAYSRGARPTEFETATEGDPKDSGWAWRTGLGPMFTDRAAYVDNKAARAIVRRVIAERVRLGLMPGGEDEVEHRDPLADVHRVYRAGEAFVSWQQIAGRLRDQMPEAYADITPDAISARIRPYEVPSVNGRAADGQVLKGAKRKDIEAAMQRREIGDGS
jgi:S-DNA-T family DNA segregation ATPase FtsK/SpoIIIE